MIIMFTSEGCVINGVDSELYDWEEKLPRIEDLTNGMPSALQKLMNSREVQKDRKATFCVWTEDGVVWHCNPMAGEDASKDYFSMIDGNPQTYVEYGKLVLSRRPAFGSCAPACRRGAGDKRR